MKKLILILTVMTLAVMASGCTDTQTTNKTYSGDGISFIYPGDWNEVDKSDMQSTVGSIADVLVAVGKDNDNVFAIEEVNLQSGQKATSPKEWGSNYKSVMQSAGLQVVGSESLTVDGSAAYLVTAKDNKSGTYLTDVYFAKKGKAYIAVYVSKTSDRQILDQILNSLKIS